MIIITECTNSIVPATDAYITSPFLFLRNSKEKVIENFVSGKIEKIQNELKAILKYCYTPIPLKNIYEQFPIHFIDYAIKENYIVPYKNIFKDYHINFAEIEINSHCNNRCIYCPVSFAPKKKQIMKMDLYLQIVDKIVRYGYIKKISLNFYNEPTLDPFFIQRIEALFGSGLNLILHTNGTKLDKDKVDVLCKYENVERVQFNIPSVELNQYKYFTGRNGLSQVIKNLQYAYSCGLPLGITVNGLKHEVNKNMPIIQDRFKNMNIEISSAATSDRAGTLKNQYAENLQLNTKLTGCFTKNILIGVNGDIPICCNDYKKNNIIANIQDGELDAIIKSPKYQYYLKKIYGFEDSSLDFICRRCWQMAITRIYKTAMKKYIWGG